MLVRPPICLTHGTPTVPLNGNGDQLAIQPLLMLAQLPSLLVLMPLSYIVRDRLSAAMLQPACHATGRGRTSENEY